MISTTLFALASGLCFGFLLGMIAGLWGSLAALRRNTRLMRQARAKIQDQRGQLDDLYQMLADSPHP